MLNPPHRWFLNLPSQLPIRYLLIATIALHVLGAIGMVGWLTQAELGTVMLLSLAGMIVASVTGMAIATPIQRLIDAQTCELQACRQTLEKAELDRRSLFTAMTDVVLIYDSQGYCRNIITQTPELLVCPLELQVGKSVYDILPVEQADSHRRTIQQVLERQQPIRVEYILEVGNEVRWFLATASPLPDGTVLWVARDISDLKRVEQTLKERESFLRAIGDNLPNGYLYQFIYEPERGYYFGYLSAGIERDAGFSISQLLEDPALAFSRFVAEDIPLIWEQIELSRQTMSICDLQVRVNGSDGQIYWMRLRSAPRQESGRIVWDGFMVDITDIKQTEEALRVSEEKFAKAFRTSPNPITLTTLKEGRYIEANKAFLRLSGYSHAEVIGKTVFELNIWANPEERDRLLHQLALQRSVYNLETTFRSKTGQSIVALVSAEIIHLNHEPCLLLVGMDITEQKRAEAAQKRAEAALQEKEQYLRLILNNVPQQIFWKDTNLTFLGCNQNWANAAGVASPEEVLGKTDFDLLPDHIAAELFRIQDRRVIINDEPELHIVAPKVKSVETGEIIWLDICKIPIHDPSGTVIGILGVIDDVTLRRQAEEALRREKERSEHLLLNILPEAIANRLKEESGVIAENYEEATILFADIVGFTELASQLPPIELVNLLNEIFSIFDQLAEFYKLEKIKTIGDAYMVVAGVPVPMANHAEAIADMALTMLTVAEHMQIHTQSPLQLRIGINTGSVVAGVIGRKKFTYDLWGNAVNIASRMESQGQAGEIQVTESTYHWLKDRYEFVERGAIDIKGGGQMTTYWLKGRKLITEC